MIITPLLHSPPWLSYCPNQPINQDIHLYKIQVAGSNTSIMDTDEFKSIISSDELNLIERLKSNDLRYNFLKTRYYLKKILSNFLNCDPKKLILNVEKGKKPKIYGLNYNLSRSGDYSIIAISEQIVGVDLEKINLNFQFKEIMTQYFSETESNWIGNSCERFFITWTRKEAVLKFTGEGLIEDMSSFSTTKQTLLRQGYDLHLTSFRLEDNYIISLARTNSMAKINHWQV